MLSSPVPKGEGPGASGIPKSRSFPSLTPESISSLPGPQTCSVQDDTASKVRSVLDDRSQPSSFVLWSSLYCAPGAGNCQRKVTAYRKLCASAAILPRGCRSYPLLYRQLDRRGLLRRDTARLGECRDDTDRIGLRALVEMDAFRAAASNSSDGRDAEQDGCTKR